MLACVRVCKCELRKCRAWRRIHMLNMLFECHVAVRLARLESDLPYEDIFCALVATIHFDVYTDISTTQAIWCIWSIRNTLTMSFTICFRFFVSQRNSFAPFSWPQETETMLLFLIRSTTPLLVHTAFFHICVLILHRWTATSSKIRTFFTQKTQNKIRLNGSNERLQMQFRCII